MNKEWTQEGIVKAKFEEMEKQIEFNEKKHTYTVLEGGNKFIVPSVTQIKSPYDPDFTAIPHDILQRKTAIGQHVHKRAEGEGVNPFAELGEIQDEELKGYCDAMDKYLLERESNPKALYFKEVTLYNPIQKYAGRADCVEVLEGEMTIVDYKTTATVDVKRIAIQLTGYYLALLTQGFDDVVKMNTRARIIQLKKDGAYKEYHVTVSPQTIDVFGALVGLHAYFR